MKVALFLFPGVRAIIEDGVVNTGTMGSPYYVRNNKEQIMALQASVFTVVEKAIADGDYMRKLVADPKGTLAAAGVDTGNADITMDLNNQAHTLAIKATNAGANWKGSISLDLSK
jgi:hypothetical protein